MRLRGFRLPALVLAAALPLAASADTLYRVSSLISERSPGEIVRVLPAPDLSILHLPTAMHVGAFDAASHRLFLTSDRYDAGLYLVDLRDQSMTKTAVDTTDLSSCCALDAQSSQLFALRGGNELLRVDPATDAMTKVLTLPWSCSMLTSDPARGRSFLLREDSPEVWVLDLATLKTSLLMQTSVMSAFVDSSTGTLYLATPLEGENFVAADLFAIDPGAPTPAPHPVLHHPGGIPVAYDTASKRIYVQRWEDFGLTSLWSVDPATGSAGETLSTGGDYNSYVAVPAPARVRAVR